MIQAIDLSKSYGEQLLFEHLTFTVPLRSRIALIARNGTGKSTLMNILAGVDTPDSGEVVRRNDITVGYLPQMPDIDPSLSVMEAACRHDASKAHIVCRYEEALASGDEKAISETSHMMDDSGSWGFESRIKEILSRLKLDDTAKSVSVLSGGELKRLALAMLLVQEPDVMLLDEPTNHLDLDMVEWLEEYLCKCGKTIFMVTHDRYFLDRVATDIYEIEAGALHTYKGSYGDFVERRAERHAQQESQRRSAMNIYRREAEWMRRMPQARGHKSRHRQEEFYRTRDKAFAVATERQVEMIEVSSRLGTKIFEAHDLSLRYGDKVLLDGYNYTFTRGEKMGIIGRNGTGKSTFLKLLTGAIAPDRGSVDLGESLRIGYYRQEGMSFDDGARVIDIVTDIAEHLTLADGSTLSASQLLTRFLFPPERQYDMVAKLSGGERRRLYLLTILMGGPNFLILDEPTNDLDILTLGILEEYLESFAGCLIVVSHDRFFMDKTVDHLLVFEGNGKLRLFEGCYTDYRNKSLEEEERRQNDNNRKPAPKPQNTEKAARPRRLTYAEKRELEELDSEIPALTERKREIEEKLSSPAPDDDVAALSVEYQTVSQSLDEKEMRWLELSEI
ncbi:MAG: ABC-F family ATP-binding cassette domain-containing protein [Rikenellaceae bacterium]|nr:ABC-F family ATP-binding cassette domain-containing protein [Rikenellaceae bacterium]